MKVMQKFKSVTATLPAKDIGRAKLWYGDKLGLKPINDGPEGVTYQIGDGKLFVYQSSYAGTNTATAATITVDDLRATVDGLRSAGVTFEQYDMPGTTWDNGVATTDAGGQKFSGAWFKDSEGNIIALIDESMI
jgi:predicted enzyme related to lactoylglutathione lyase